MRSVGIVGVGLIGGSFGLALRAAGFTGRIVGVSSERHDPGRHRTRRNRNRGTARAGCDASAI